MLSRDKGKIIVVIAFCLFLVTCENKSHTNNYYRKSIDAMGKAEYHDLYRKLNDSVNLWITNRLRNYEAEATYKFHLDSLLCFNITRNRFISCRHLYVNLPDATSDDLQFIYGEKINEDWFFFKGPSITIPREMVKNHPIHTPLSYQQLHQIALKEVYSGYLSRNGEINENWFTSKFEGNGWVNWDDTPEKIKSYTRKDYEQFHLRKVRGNWYGVKKDSLNAPATQDF
ncbi:MAG: hypothetical protein H0W61_12550 [Bacteroidetes bacterium]|nr:hypothetical protein [Bacteroidota bacterium]